MKKYLTLALILLFSITFVVAGKPGFTANEVIPSNGQAEVIVPSNAVEVAHGVFSLGSARDVDGRIVQGFMFIDNKKQNAKPQTTCGNDICEAGENKNNCALDCGGSSGTTESTCFSLFAKGASWKETEPYVTDTGVDLALTETSLNAWDSEVVFNIFGTRDASGTVDGADLSSPDGKNEVMFENLGSTNTIAYTVVWGIFRGPPSGRKLVEWDAVFNSDYPWSLAGEAGKMDYQNIATHEFGHSLGLGHPSDGCTEETMFRFADIGETKKRSLANGDIAGVNNLY